MRLCANISWLFTDKPFLERPEAARIAGFSGVEFHTAEGHSAQDVLSAARDANVKIVLFNAWPGDFLNGGPGLSGVPGRASEFREEIRVACEFGAGLGGARVQIGQSRIPDGATREECLRVFTDNLRFAARELAKAGCQALVEPMNATDVPGILIPDVSAASAALRTAGIPEAGLQFDCYHEHMAGTDVCRSLGDHAHEISHLQVSDAPGRGQPGSGRMPYARIWEALHKVRYDNWVGAEYRPDTSTEQTLAWIPACTPSAAREKTER